LRELRLGIGDRAAQHAEPGFVTADVGAQFGQGGLRFVARSLQALRHLALVRDLLFDPRQRAANLVDVGLRLVQGFAGFLASDAVGFDLAFGFALLGDQLLQPGFFLRELFAQLLQPCIEAAVFQRFPLGVLCALCARISFLSLYS